MFQSRKWMCVCVCGALYVNLSVSEREVGEKLPPVGSVCVSV